VNEFGPLGVRVWWAPGWRKLSGGPSKTVGAGGSRLNCEMPTQMAIPLQMESVDF